jgi:hypothetical protein
MPVVIRIFVHHHKYLFAVEEDKVFPVLLFRITAAKDAFILLVGAYIFHPPWRPKYLHLSPFDAQSFAAASCASFKT